ncbi:antirepressor [Paractinoplanes deccanensis]|uniref:Antirepressor n=1 Tax=Paractinoplanes deccanensis TaxID=113561 RepID=A0ABQ3XZT4_9ACTN|nr:BRO family protein [Actinoplanes deccanensis]GID73258.1 antirepressor [Actinoplanes deccanensis]
MSSIARVFGFGGAELRTTLVDEEPWFVAADICRVLGLKNTTMALRALDEDEKGLSRIDTPGGQQNLAVVNESGLYALIVRSDKPNAKPFRRWVTGEVLPAIRKTGRYDITEQNTNHPAIPQSFADALQLAADQAREIERQNNAIAELEPRAAQADHHRSADAKIPIGDFANNLKAWAKQNHGVQIRHKDVWDFLGDIGLLIRGNTARNNQPTAFATDRDFVRVKTSEYETETRGLQSSTSPRLTPAGEGWAWDRAVKRIATHGSLAAPTKAIEGAK